MAAASPGHWLSPDPLHCTTPHLAHFPLGLPASLSQSKQDVRPVAQGKSGLWHLQSYFLS